MASTLMTEISAGTADGRVGSMAINLYDNFLGWQTGFSLDNDSLLASAESWRLPSTRRGRATRAP
jgi:hypothetical protein